MKTRVLSVSLAAALAGSLMLAQPAAALTFVDPVNLVQNTLTAIRTLEQINNQINQLQNEAQMLMNQARNLANLDFNIVNRLRSTLATTERLIAEAQGLAYDVQNMDREFARLYPEQYAATVSGDQMLRDARERWKNTLDGLHTAMRMQAQVSQNLAQDESALADLVSQSQSATGALQAAQATNQLLALQAKQSIQAQQLQITQDRAASLELARQAAADEENPLGPDAEEQAAIGDLDDLPIPTITPHDKAAEKRLYRELARRFHPDLAEGAAELAYRTSVMTAVNAAYTAGDVGALYDLAGELEPGELRELEAIETHEVRRMRERLLQCRRRRRKVTRRLQILRDDKTARLWRKARELDEKNEDWWSAVRRDLEAARARLEGEVMLLKEQIILSEEAG